MNTVNDIDFEQEVLQSSGIVLVDFGAAWCAPCKRQLPILEQFAQTNPKIKVVSLDIDDSPITARKYGIRSVPTLIFFKEGMPILTKNGLTSLEKLNNDMLLFNK